MFNKSFQGTSGQRGFFEIQSCWPNPKLFKIYNCKSRLPLNSSVLTLALLTGGFGEGLPEFFLVFDFCFSLEAVYFVSFWKFQFKEIEACSRVVCSFGN